MDVQEQKVRHSLIVFLDTDLSCQPFQRSCPLCFSGLSNSAQVMQAPQPSILSLSPLTPIQILPVLQDPLLLLSGKGTRLKTGDLDSTLGLMIY